jgi:hypothetical protein
MRKAEMRGESIQAMFIIVRYKPLVLPVLVGSLKCSINISIQNRTNVFVAEKTIKEILVNSGLTEDTIPTRASMFKIKNARVSFLFPKYFKTFTLLESSPSAKREDSVYNNPTYFSEITLVKNVELT